MTIAEVIVELFHAEGSAVTDSSRAKHRQMRAWLQELVERREMDGDQS